MTVDSLLIDAPSTAASSLTANSTLRTAIKENLTPHVDAIDRGKLYPADAMRALGAAGAWGSHIPSAGEADLTHAIRAMGSIGEVCGATAFMAWCQDTLVWYLGNTENAFIKKHFLKRAASGSLLGGTGLSNPMKSFFGIESLRLKGKRVEGGYVLRGSLPWVSNLGPDHLFGTIFALEDRPDDPVMFLADCSAATIKLSPCDEFLAMDGTGTYSVMFKDHFVSDDIILADHALPFVKKIRAGFVMLQMGMALGVIRDCIAIMNEVRPSLGHVNKFLDRQPDDFETDLAALDATIGSLARTPLDTDPLYWRRVLETRLAASELSLAVSQAAMLHAGARGYVRAHRAQRRLREAYFVAIVTPATKQLQKMLAEMPT